MSVSGGSLGREVSTVSLSEIECKSSDMVLSWPFMSLISLAFSAIVLLLGGRRGLAGGEAVGGPMAAAAGAAAGSGDTGWAGCLRRRGGMVIS